MLPAIGNATLCGDRVVEVQKLEVFLRFCQCPRDPLRRSAWSRCKTRGFFAFFDMPARPSAEIGVVEVQNSFLFFLTSFDIPARPSAEIGVVEVQKLEVFRSARATLCGDRRGRGSKTRGFLRF